MADNFAPTPSKVPLPDDQERYDQLFPPIVFTILLSLHPIVFAPFVIKLHKALKESVQELRLHFGVVYCFSQQLSAAVCHFVVKVVKIH